MENTVIVGSYLVQEDLAVGVFEVHVKLDGGTVVILDVNVFQSADVGHKLQYQQETLQKKKETSSDQIKAISLWLLYIPATVPLNVV